jgi:hypothetical protein
MTQEEHHNALLLQQQQLQHQQQQLNDSTVVGTMGGDMSVLHLGGMNMGNMDDAAIAEAHAQAAAAAMAEQQQAYALQQHQQALAAHHAAQQAAAAAQQQQAASYHQSASSSSTRNGVTSGLRSSSTLNAYRDRSSTPLTGRRKDMASASVVGTRPIKRSRGHSPPVDYDAYGIDERRKGGGGGGGSSCHQCKSRRNYNDLTYCTSSLNKKNKVYFYNAQWLVTLNGMNHCMM